MSQVGVEYNSIRAGVQDWRALSQMMTRTSGSLADQTISAIPPTARTAAQAFLTAWAGYAAESADIATGFAGALEATQNNYTRADDEADRRFADLDGRLGPAR